MKKITSALALAALLGVPAAQAEVDFGGDFDVRGYSVQTGDSPRERTQGYDQRIRVRAHFKNDDGIQVHTRLVLSDRNWTGDGIAGPAGPYTNTGRDTVSLDYGFVQIPMLGGIVRVGRQEANWNNHLLTSDDRRDRISFIKPMGGTTLVLLTDKRVEGALGNTQDDGDLYAAAAVGSAGGLSWGALLAYFDGHEDTAWLHEVMAFSPWVSGTVGPVTLTGGFNLLWGGDKGQFFGDTPGFTDDGSLSAYLRGALDVGPVKVEAQYVGTRDGGLVGGGFDTFSSLINNSPDNNQSATSVYAIGGLGQEDVDRDVIALRVTGNVTDKLKLVGAVGYIDVDNGAAGDDSSEFADLQAHYQVAPSTTVWATAGMLGENDQIANAATEDAYAFSVNLKTNF
ncbi:hypothetical protein [Alkalilimnicola sp. S0819]|uniref:hypothetical protein n=1 Tax=Alkalilimnicola sp. S0819 TaxID=2613922 RepID=UPI001261A809|nr:hypothetical protein [Alkalilimnicola sp. S0819]KAB7622999.1 hypothetical protein F3N43_10735 [Alkalilimnicola sp. S0819]MPQ17111.1 hypothetical protein [Alkalilimnicola sp. S0819]